MKSLVWHGKRDVKVEEVPVLAVTDPGDVICKVTGSTVCGSDLHLYHKEIMQMQAGDILGHEWMRIVDEVGPAVIRPGQALRQGLRGLFGYTHFAGGFAGGQAEYVRAPFGEINLLEIPDSIPDEKALYLSDIIPTSYHSTVCAEAKEGKSVAIWGMDPVGLYAAEWSKLAGAKRAVAIDNVLERLSMARDNIGCEAINFSETEDVVEALYEKEPEEINCCIDAAAF